jgi:hypothetical protein
MDMSRKITEELQALLRLLASLQLRAVILQTLTMHGI